MQPNAHYARPQKTLFRRYEGNPILTADDWPYLANSVFNPGAAEHNEATVLLVRVEDMRGFSHLTLARSKNGRTNWDIDKEPTLLPDPYYKEERFGLEDPRIVWLPERQEYAICYVSFSPDGPMVSLTLTKDFKSFKRSGPMLPPEDKDACLFPRLINGDYMLIHRPLVRGEAHVWCAFSPDLVHWGKHKILIPSRPGWWDSTRVGLGPPPIETEEGWLIIYHGVRVTASGSLYRVGLALLDLEKPWIVRKRCDDWIFGPYEDYERIGDVPGVTFPTGTIVDRQNRELRMYYGAADSNICLAVANFDDLLDYALTANGAGVT